MIIDCISDLHGNFPKLEGGDLLIVAGDLTARDTFEQHCDFKKWFYEQPYKKRVIIAGNHDNQMKTLPADDLVFSTYNTKTGEQASYASYLMDSGTEFEGLKIWGSPWTSRFPGINPHCCAFTGENDEEIAPKFDLIPSDVDILITHSPPFTIRDMTTCVHQVGSPSLMAHHISRLRPKLWVFGHIHEGYGQEGPYQWNGTRYVNASHVNERYQPINKPIRIIMEEGKVVGQVEENEKD